MKRKELLSLAFIIILVTTTAIICSEKSTRSDDTPMNLGSLSSINYKDLWKRVDSLSGQGLNRSALEVVDTICGKAGKEANAPQFVKAMLHTLRFESFIEEESYVKAINKLSEEIKTAQNPIKPVMHSLLADVYWHYYQSNRWNFKDRTATVAYEQDDIRTWDLKRLTAQTIEQHILSLSNPEELKRTKLDIYDEIITAPDKTARKLRPTLYDFIAHRAADFFMNEEADLIKPAYSFEIDDPKYLSSYSSFIKLPVSSQDTFSLKLHAMQILKDLLSFHKNDSDPSALIDADIKRIKYVREHAVFERKDSLYLAALLSLKKKFAKQPSVSEISYEIAQYYYDKGLTYQPLVSDTNKWMLKKAYELCTEVIDKQPEDNYGSDCCKYLKSLIEQKDLQFTVEKATAPGIQFKTFLQYKNVPTVFIRIVKCDPVWFYSASRKYEIKELVKRYLAQEKAKEWSQKLENDGDFQQHAVEIPIPALPCGFYILLIGDDKDFSCEKHAVATTDFWVSNISYIMRRSTQGGTEFHVLDRTSGKALGKVTAQVYLETYDYNSREYTFKKDRKYTSDANGNFLIPPSKEGYNYYSDLTSGDDRLHSERFYNQRPYENDMRPQLRTVFFTDRAIYRPGQTIYFKGIVLEKTGTNTIIKTNHATTVTLFDVNYQKVSDVRMTSNDYGTFSGTFTAPTGVVNGAMTISNENGSLSIRVEEYKRPKFEVIADTLTGEYRVDDDIKVTGKAKAYAGSNIDNAPVSYRVVRTASYPWWCYWWFRYCPSSPEMEIANGTTATNDKGEFNFSFKAIPDRSIAQSYEPRFNYSITIDVTDNNGETRSTQKMISVGYTALNLSITLPEQVDKASKENYPINTTNCEGKYQYAKGTITIYRIHSPERLFRQRLWQQPDRHLLSKEEYYKAFPHDPFADEDAVSKWEKGKQVFNLAFDTQKDSLLHIDKLNKFEPGQYLLEAESKDKYGKNVREMKYFTLYSPAEKTVPNHSYDWFTCVKTQAEPGETVDVLVGSKATDVSILYEIESKDKIIHSEWLVVNNEQKKLSIPIREEHRGNITVHVTFVKENRNYNHDTVITVPFTNKQLDIAFETFRNKLLPGQKEEWKLTIRGKKGEKVAAELLAGMYDASLDAFASQNWLLQVWESYYTRLSWQTHYCFSVIGSNLMAVDWNTFHSKPNREYDQLNYFGWEVYRPSSHAGFGYGGKMYAMDAEMPPSPQMARSVMYESAAEPRAEKKAGIAGAPRDKHKEQTVGALMGGDSEKQSKPVSSAELSMVKVRTNFNETAFFYPHLQTNKDGDVIISFTMPEALTRWKFMGLGHTRDLKIGQIEKEVITEKDLMLTPNPPRFFRENDTISFSAKISNVSDKDLSGTAQLMLFDALTMKPVDAVLGNTQPQKPFTVRKGQSASLSWDLVIPEHIQAVTYRIVAKAADFSDGEEMAVPVLTNRMLVTESMPLPIRGKQTKKYSLEKLVKSGSSKTLTHEKLTLEYTANPAWYAVQALPYLMEYPYECSEQMFSRFYANSIASHIANAHPRIKQVFESWKNFTPDALLSNLEKNQELKGLLLQETPWVLQAKDESTRKHTIALLFDLNRMADELQSTLQKLQQVQAPNGGFPWFKGMPDNRYITQHIVTGMGHLDHLGVRKIREDSRTWDMIGKAVSYLDDRIREDYEYVLKHYPDSLELNHLDHTQIQYLYARSYFLKDVSLSRKNKDAFDYYVTQAQKYWLKNNRYMQGMISLALNRVDQKKTALSIIKSLKENAIHSEEMGMYWNDITSGYYWYQLPIETIALLIEAFDEVAGDTSSVEGLKIWLLKNKQTNDWKTTKATTEACYALLLKGTDWLSREPQVSISVGNISVDPNKLPDVKVEAGTGYFKTSWSGSAIIPQMGEVTVTKGDDGVSWGALYWQYFEQLDKITTHETPLKLKKKLFIERNTPTGPVIEPVSTTNALKIGDKLIVRIELRVDRDMEYVHMKDMRAAGFEPVNVISTYKYQGGLGYYESTKDASTNFFIDYMPKGTYVFEYPLRVSYKGKFSNGITTIQCMYAPEFTSHSEGIRVGVK